MSSEPKASGKARVVVIADVAASNVGIGVFEVGGGKPARLLVAEREATSLDEHNVERLSAAAVVQLASIAERVRTLYQSRHDRRLIQEAHVIIRAPWVSSKSVAGTKQFDTEKIVQASAISEIARDLLAEQKDLDSAQIFETGVTRIKVNGYPTSTPEGKRGHSLRVNALVSTCDPSLRGGIEEVLRKTFHVKPLFHSATRVMSALVHTQVCPSDCVIIDMTAEATDIMCIRNGVPSEHATLLEGAHSIIRRIANGGMPEDALALIRMVGEDRCEEGACDAIKMNIARVEPELVRQFGETFSKLIVERRLPTKLMLLAHHELTPWLSSFFSRIDFGQFTFTTRPFLVSPMSGSALDPFATTAPDATPDIALLVASVLVNSDL